MLAKVTNKSWVILDTIAFIRNFHHDNKRLKFSYLDWTGLTPFGKYDRFASNKHWSEVLIFQLGAFLHIKHSINGTIAKLELPKKKSKEGSSIENIGRIDFCKEQ